MRDALRQLMDVMLKGIVVDEGFAQELADMAALARDDFPGFAEAALTLSRQHRIKALLLRARLAALSIEHSDVMSGGE